VLSDDLVPSREADLKRIFCRRELGPGKQRRDAIGPFHSLDSMGHWGGQRRIIKTEKKEELEGERKKNGRIGKISTEIVIQRSDRDSGQSKVSS